MSIVLQEVMSIVMSLMLRLHRGAAASCYRVTFCEQRKNPDRTTKDHDIGPPVPAEDLRFLSIAQYAECEGISLPTAKRAIKSGAVQVTQLSARRIGIRIDHYRAHCERRVRQGGA
jgi:hypothetical protein